MTVLTNILSALSSVFTTYVPDLGAGIYQLFTSIFTVTTTVGDVATTNLNVLGYVAAGFIGIGIVSGLVATVLGILRIKRKKGGKARKARKAY